MNLQTRLNRIKVWIWWVLHKSAKSREKLSDRRRYKKFK